MPANMASLKALHNAEYGFTQQVRQKAGEALKSADSRRVRGNVAVAYAFIGDSAESKKLTTSSIPNFLPTRSCNPLKFPQRAPHAHPSKQIR